MKRWTGQEEISRAIKQGEYLGYTVYGVVSNLGDLYCRGCAAHYAEGKTWDMLVICEPHSLENCDACHVPLSGGGKRR